MTRISRKIRALPGGRTMQRWITGLMTLGFLLGVVNAPAQQTPDMPETVVQFLKKIDRSKTIAYTVKVWGHDPIFDADGVSRRSLFRVLQTYEIKAQRPNRLAILGG